MVANQRSILYIHVVSRATALEEHMVIARRNQRATAQHGIVAPPPLAWGPHKAGFPRSQTSRIRHTDRNSGAGAVRFASSGP